MDSTNDSVCTYSAPRLLAKLGYPFSLLSFLWALYRQMDKINNDVCRALQNGEKYLLCSDEMICGVNEWIPSV